MSTTTLLVLLLLAVVGLLVVTVPAYLAWRHPGLRAPLTVAATAAGVCAPPGRGSAGLPVAPGRGRGGKPHRPAAPWGLHREGAGGGRAEAV
ncbi:hypothetical protein ACWGI1_34995 [Streptomyces sp. NPDC054835]